MAETRPTRRGFFKRIGLNAATAGVTVAATPTWWWKDFARWPLQMLFGWGSGMPAASAATAAAPEVPPMLAAVLGLTAVSTTVSTPAPAVPEDWREIVWAAEEASDA